MRILWITNITFPEAESKLSGNVSLQPSGGWLLGASDALTQKKELKLYVASVSRLVNKLTCIEGEHITYFVLPYGNGNKKINHDYEPLWAEVHERVQPDVVHIHGTEFTHGLAYIEACGSNNVCVSIQGLVSACSSYYYYGLTRKNILQSVTPYSFIFGGIMKGYREFKEKAGCEIEIIKRVKHIIGRTSWDRSRIWAINPKANYHFCNETLRKSFYQGDTWKYENCTPHTIFISQAGYPLKGLHMVLKSLPLVLRHYPDTMVRIAGNDITLYKTLKQKLLLSDYGNIIRKIIKKHHLESHIVFTGLLDSDGMKKEYLKSNVFVCPSTIENSPNSLGEAQMLGVPVLASYVGGIPDMMRGDEDHLYRFEEVEMLAQKLVDLFDKMSNVKTEVMRQKAIQRHNTSKNLDDMLGIYYVIKDK